MTTFAADALWKKSRLFIDRALKARDENDDLEYHLWAAISIELLGKSALASIHPALVADPSDFKSLLGACRGEETPQGKSITFKTVFDRLAIVLPAFDDRAARDCKLMATRRNAELHSGESPVAGLDPRAWVPPLWRSAKILLLGQERTLEDWVGAAEATRIETVLEDTAEVIRQTVLARIERKGKEFHQRYPKLTLAHLEIQRRAEARLYPGQHMHAWDAHQPISCPACGLKAWMFGQEMDRDVIDETYESDGPEEWHYRHVQIFRVIYTVEAFRCLECLLELYGTDEIGFAGLPPEFEDEVEEEPQYEDYGNE